MAKNKEFDIDFKYNLKLYWEFLRNYKPLLFSIMFVTLILAATRTSIKFLFKIIIDDGNEFLKGTLLGNEYIQILIIIALVYIGIRIIAVLGDWLKIHLINILDSNLMLDLKRKFFNHIIHLSHNFHTKHKTGSLISRLIRGSSAMERMTDIIVFNITPLIFQIVIVVGALLYFSWIPALVVFMTVIIFLGYSFIIQQKQKKANIIVNQTEDFEKANISDFFTNIDSIKYFGKEDTIKKKFASLTEKTKLATLKHWNYFRWLDSGHSLILGLGTLLLIYFPIVSFLNEEITIGTVVFIYTVLGDLMGPLFGFVYGIRNFYRSMADFEALFQYGKIENEIKDKPRAETLKIRHGDIEFRNVSFRYHKKRGLLDNFSLRIPRHKKIAFVGHSGSGKSTLIKLLYRLYDVDEGAIHIDGKDIRDVKQESLRSELSIVPQECILFDDTLYSNIAFSNSKASRKEIFKAMKFAQLDKLVEIFPKKHRTIVGERGIRLSGGEKQRVSIARAILANKKVLVLDEATSSLDSETEYEIQKDLGKLMKGRTTIIIAHRLSTIMKADTIVVLKNGKIVQKGNHKQLIKRKGEYKKLWNLQKGGYIK